MLRPILLTNRIHHIRVDLRWTIKIKLSEIEGLQTIKEIKRKTPGFLNAVVFGEPQYLLILKNPVQANGFFGLTKSVQQIILSVDNKHNFESELKGAMNL